MMLAPALVPHDRHHEALAISRPGTSPGLPHDELALSRAPVGERRLRGAHRRIAALACALVVTGCATTIERAKLPFESPVIEVAPGTAYERCLRLLAGDHLYFHYRSDPPMSFAIRRRADDAILSYVVREASREDAGVFPVPEEKDYCLRWEPQTRDAPWPSLLRYEIRLTQEPAT